VGEQASGPDPGADAGPAPAAPRTFKLTLAYDGTGLVGWQRQAAGVSVQGLLEDVLAQLTAVPHVTVIGAGRTDAGVHARGQVASVVLDTTRSAADLQRGANALLPQAVRVLSVEVAEPGFHARFGAKEKSYAYHMVVGPLVSPFDARYAWHIPYPLDVGAVRSALPALQGRHDFAAFQSTGSDIEDSVRTLTEVRLDEAHAEGGGTRLVLTLAGNGFLRHMVRAIAGSLVEVGRGRWPAGRIAEILASADRSQAGPTAPAHGLFLVSVRYEQPVVEVSRRIETGEAPAEQGARSENIG
jgi:tRNA pseudouridine38-40 synthase